MLCATGETRFATNFIMLDSLVKCKRELQKTVVDEKWEAWMERSATQLKKGAQTCKAAVMDDVWFSKAEELYRLAKCARNSVLLYDRCTVVLLRASCHAPINLQRSGGWHK